MAISVSMIVLGSQLAMTVADGVPVFDIVRSCKLDLAATAGLTDGQSQKACVNDEKRARQQLRDTMVEVFSPEQGRMYSAGEYWRDSELRQLADLSSDESMGQVAEHP